MSDAGDALRSAADSLEDARTDLEYGDLDAPLREIEAIASQHDDILGDLTETLREVGVTADTAAEADTSAFLLTADPGTDVYVARTDDRGGRWEATADDEGIVRNEDGESYSAGAYHIVGETDDE